MIKKIGLFVSLFFLGFTPVFADSLNLQEFLNSYLHVVLQQTVVPSSSQYIQLKYTNIAKGTDLYTTLQKAVYLDIFPNAPIALPLTQKITQKQALSIISQGFDDFGTGDENQLVSVDWLKNILLSIQDSVIKETVGAPLVPQNNPLSDSLVLQDVYTRLTTSYISSGVLNKKDLIYGGIKGFVDGLNDPYTSYFPPTDAKSFDDDLQGEYYGIGAYVDMQKPGVLMIISPIKGSPAEKAGVKGGDRILQIDDHQINQDISLEMATNWIKGPAGTLVTLKVYRDGKLVTLSITRAKVIVQNVEYTVYGTGNSAKICSVVLRMFSMGIAHDFALAMDALSSKSCSKYIFDLRNNPGGSLEDVGRMLDYFVPTHAPSVIIKSKFATEQVDSMDTLSPKIIDKPIRILINQGSASASEIFAGTVKDYAPHALLIGETSYGKGSVQNVLSYADGSMLKYTIAKWYTGKSQKNIDNIGITPDVKIVDNTATSLDEGLDYAMKH